MLWAGPARARLAEVAVLRAVSLFALVGALFRLDLRTFPSLDKKPKGKRQKTAHTQLTHPAWPKAPLLSRLIS